MIGFYNQSVLDTPGPQNTDILPHLWMCMSDEIAQDLSVDVIFFGLFSEEVVKRTCSAVIPFTSAFFTLSRVREPMIMLGNRALKEMKRLSTAICKGLSKTCEHHARD